MISCRLNKFPDKLQLFRDSLSTTIEKANDVMSSVQRSTRGSILAQRFPPCESSLDQQRARSFNCWKQRVDFPTLSWACYVLTQQQRGPRTNLHTYESFTLSRRLSSLLVKLLLTDIFQFALDNGS
jgi:hypothetical protein